MEDLIETALTMSNEQLRAILRHEELDIKSLELEIDNLITNIKKMKFNLSIKESTIRAIEQALIMKEIYSPQDLEDRTSQFDPFTYKEE